MNDILGDNDSNIKIHNRFRLSDGLMIAGIPLLVYFLKFIYDYGYGNYFGVPPELVSFSIPSVFVAITTMVAVMIIIVAAFGQAINEWMGGKEKAGIEPLIHNIFLLIIIVGVLWYVQYATGLTSIFYIFLMYLVLFTIRHFIFPLFPKKGVKGYINKIKKQTSKIMGRHKDFSDIFLFPFDLVLYRRAFIGLIIVGLIAVVYSFGYAGARGQTSFYVQTGSPQWVVARIVDDKAVFIEVHDREQTGKIKYQSLVSDELVLDKVDLGKLEQHK